MTDTSTTSAYTPMFIAAVLGDQDGSTPVLIVQPGDEFEYQQLTDRLTAVAFHRLRLWEWTQSHWTVSPPSAVDVVGGFLERVMAGRYSLRLSEPIPITPMWRSAALERRALVVLVPAGTFTDSGVTTGVIDEALRGVVLARRAVAGAAKVRFDTSATQRPL